MLKDLLEFLSDSFPRKAIESMTRMIRVKSSPYRLQVSWSISILEQVLVVVLGEDRLKQKRKCGVLVYVLIT